MPNGNPISNLLSPYQVGNVIFKNRMLAGPLGVLRSQLRRMYPRAQPGVLRDPGHRRRRGSPPTTILSPVAWAPAAGWTSRGPVDIEMEKCIQRSMSAPCIGITLWPLSSSPTADSLIRDMWRTRRRRAQYAPHGKGRRKNGHTAHDGGRPHSGGPAQGGDPPDHPTIFASCCATAAHSAWMESCSTGPHNKLIRPVPLQAPTTSAPMNTAAPWRTGPGSASNCQGEAIRERCGDKLPLELRLSGDEGYPGGITIDETVEVPAVPSGL